MPSSASRFLLQSWRSKTCYSSPFFFSPSSQGEAFACVSRVRKKIRNCAARWSVSEPLSSRFSLRVCGSSLLLCTYDTGCAFLTYCARASADAAIAALHGQRRLDRVSASAQTPSVLEYVMLCRSPRVRVRVESTASPHRKRGISRWSKVHSNPKRHPSSASCEDWHCLAFPLSGLILPHNSTAVI